MSLNSSPQGHSESKYTIAPDRILKGSEICSRITKYHDGIHTVK